MEASTTPANTTEAIHLNVPDYIFVQNMLLMTVKIISSWIIIFMVMYSVFSFRVLHTGYVSRDFMLFLNLVVLPALSGFFMLYITWCAGSLLQPALISTPLFDNRNDESSLDRPIQLTEEERRKEIENVLITKKIVAIDINNRLTFASTPRGNISPSSSSETKVCCSDEHDDPVDLEMGRNVPVTHYRPGTVCVQNTSSDQPPSSTSSPELHNVAANCSDVFGKSTDNIENMCDICLMGYSVGEEICWSHNKECNHVFHKDCILDWLLRNSSCPLCRRDYLLTGQDIGVSDDALAANDHAAIGNNDAMPTANEYAVVGENHEGTAADEHIDIGDYEQVHAVIGDDDVIPVANGHAAIGDNNETPAIKEQDVILYNNEVPSADEYEVIGDNNEVHAINDHEVIRDNGVVPSTDECKIVGDNHPLSSGNEHAVNDDSDEVPADNELKVIYDNDDRKMNSDLIPAINQDEAIYDSDEVPSCNKHAAICSNNELPSTNEHVAIGDNYEAPAGNKNEDIVTTMK